MIEAIKAIDTRTSALMSNLVTSPTSAPLTMGIPHGVYWVKALVSLFLNYAGKMLYGLGKVGYGLVGVAVFDAFPDAMVQMPLQNDLSHLVQGFFYGVYLNEEVLTRDILVYHLVDCLYLSGDSV
jgi:hypothetical protein